MKRYFLLLALLIFIGCGKTKNATRETSVPEPEKELGFPVIDVTKQYPKSEKICLQDIADIKYILLETNDDFLCHGNGSVAYISDSLIIYQNDNSTGEILVFDGNGKARQKINKKGGSGEKYTVLSGVIYDKTENELYVNDRMSKRILVYDLNGKFKRSFRYSPRTIYSHIYLFDKQSLLVYNGSSEYFENEKYPFKLISKQTGEIMKEVSIPFTKRISPDIHYSYELSTVNVNSPLIEPAVKVGNTWILNETSSDTIYQLLEDYTLLPVMAQTPSVQSMGENPQHLNFSMDHYPYQFLFIQKKEVDREIRTGFPTTFVIYDKKTGKIFEQNFYNADRPDKETGFSARDVNPMENSKQTFDIWPAHRLKKWLKENLLTGKLKEIAEQIDEDDNLVIMIITFKQ